MIQAPRPRSTLSCTSLSERVCAQARSAGMPTPERRNVQQRHCVAVDSRPVGWLWAEFRSAQCATSGSRLPGAGMAPDKIGTMLSIPGQGLSAVSTDTFPPPAAQLLQYQERVERFYGREGLSLMRMPQSCSKSTHISGFSWARGGGNGIPSNTGGHTTVLRPNGRLPG